MMEMALRIMVVIACLFLLTITIKSHLKLRKRRTDTIGRTLYRFLIGFFTVSGIFFGINDFMYVFMFTAIFTERLIVYRACHRDDKLSRFLRKINW